MESNVLNVQDEIDIDQLSIRSFAFSEIVVEDNRIDELSEVDDYSVNVDVNDVPNNGNDLVDTDDDKDVATDSDNSENEDRVDDYPMNVDVNNVRDNGSDLVDMDDDEIVDTDGDNSESEDGYFVERSNSHSDSNSMESCSIGASDNGFAFVLSHNCCNNCRRIQTTSDSIHYRVRLKQSCIKKTSFQRKFSNYKWGIVSVAVGEAGGVVCSDYLKLKLCGQCQIYLTQSMKSKKKIAETCWPAMVWKWLSSEDAVSEYGNKLWTLIPELWRRWWLDSVRSLHPCYRAVTVQQPPASFVDVTADKNDFETTIEENCAGSLAKACDKYLHATVFCPWGEMEYLHQCGSVPLDVVVTRLFGDSLSPIEGNVRKQLHYVTGIMDDFLDGDYESILGNPEWMVKPSVYIESSTGIPVVLTCRKHNRGCKHRYFYLPRNPGGMLSSKVADQLTPAVIRPRTLKPMKLHQFSDSYSMQEMQGQFNGVDTVRVCDHHNFSADSKILWDREEVSLSGRKDLRALVKDWGEDGTLPPTVAEGRLAEAERYGPTAEETKRCCKGATFMTLQDSLKLQGINKAGNSRVVLIRKKGQWEECHFVPSWPTRLVNVHPLDLHGAPFAVLPKMYDSSVDTRLVFYLAAMHASLSILWESSDKNIETQNSWEGWLLAYLGRQCFPSCITRAKNNPFKFASMNSNINSFLELQKRIGTQKGISLSVNDLSSTASSDFNHTSDGDSHVSTSNRSMASSGSCTIGWNNNSNENDNASCGWNDNENENEPGKNDDVSMGWNSDEETESELFTDGCFHPADLQVLFRHRTDVMVGSILEVQTMLGSIKEDTKCMIVYQRMLSPVPHRLSIKLCCHKNCEWELRFLGGCNNGNVKDRFVLTRHGGIFPGWWRQSYRNANICDFSRKRLTGNRNAIHCKDWDVAVYVRKQSIPLEECREIFLRSMGCPTNIFCREHNLPLITAPYGTKVDCCRKNDCIASCSRSITLRCPVQDCSSAICKAHAELMTKTRNRIDVQPPARVDTPAATSLISDILIDSDYSERMDIESEDDSASLDNFDLGINVANLDEMGDVDLDSDVEDNLIHEVLFDENVPVDGNGSDTQAYGETDIPIARNDKEPLTVRGDPSSIPGCCILNNVGSLLARKGSKIRGSMNQRFFLQRIVSTTPGRTVPLIYPEAMLFPSLFWKDGSDEGAILGAVPSALMAHDSTLQKYGFASLQSHFYNRLTNPTLGTSTDPRYINYAFDSVVNLGCRHEDVRVVLHRGVRGTQNGVRIADSGPGTVTDKSLFDSDSVDSRPTVNKLAAAVAQKQATYFYTHTCNAHDHFGIAPIRRWLDSEAIMEIYCNGSETEREKEEIRQAIHEAASVTLLRNWMEVSILYMSYLTTSAEKPLGTIEDSWWRFEFQDSQGNLPHIHSLLWLRDGEPLTTTQNRIAGEIMDLIRPDEIDNLIAEGLLSCAGEMLEVQELARRVLVHICSSRCLRRTGPADGELVCRVGDNEMESPNSRVHSIGTVNVEHSKEAMEVLVDVGLFQYNAKTRSCEPIVDVLTATKHYPPSNNSEGIISPCNGRLFVLGRSNDNLKLVKNYFLCRYLAKYLALVDENNRVYIGAMSKEGNVVTMEQETLHNTKITSSAIHEAKRDVARRKRDPTARTGRAVSQMEMLCVLLGYDQVYTTLRFIHIPTLPLEERPALDRKQPFAQLKEEGVVSANANPRRPQDLDAGNLIASYKVRNMEQTAVLPLWRQVGTMESLVLRDQCLAVHTVDAITLFGIRPPELRFVRRPNYFYRWFFRASKEWRKKSFASTLELQRRGARPELTESCWIDGSNCRIFVRPSMLAEIIQYLEYGDPETNERRNHKSFYSWDMEVDGLIPDVGANRSINGNEQGPPEYPWKDTYRLFEMLRKNMENPPRRSTSRYSRAAEKWDDMKARFIGPAAMGEPAKVPIVWYNSIKPIQGGRWLLHILLSMGEFDCETNLLGYGNMVENFVRARLISNNYSRRDKDVNALIGKYITEQLVFLPGGKQQFDRHTVAAARILRQTLLGKTTAFATVPASLYTHIVEEQDKKTRAYLYSIRKRLATTTLKDLRKANMMPLPDKVEEVVAATLVNPAKWKCSPVRNEKQSEASFAEQKEVLRIATEQLNKYQFSTPGRTKGVIIIGVPGAGKTTCMQASILEAMCRGLNVSVVTVMSERGSQLGGKHLAIMFNIPVSEHSSPGRLAELAIGHIMRNPKVLAFLRTADIIYLDELGLLAAEILAVMDIILRRLRNSTEFMGGVLLMSSMDQHQLRPCQGRPPLLSPHILTNFVFCALQHSVRACDDPNLRRIVDISRLPSRLISTAVRQQLKDLVKNSCTFVNNWDDPLVQRDALRMFATQRARRDAEKRMLAKVKQQHRNNMLCAHAQDFESSTEGNWVKATKATSRLLVQVGKVKEPKELYFYPRAIYEITFNREGRFSQSQLSVLAEMPSFADVRNFEPVTLYVAPEGMKAIPSKLTTEQDFLRESFTRQLIGTAPERPKDLGSGILGKRRQYGLHHRFAATIHAAMGQDLPNVVTKIIGDKMYHLFMREQVVVLLSRTHYAKDIIFVGDAEETAEALAVMLDSDGPYSEYMEYLVEKLLEHSSTNSPCVDLTSQDLFHPIDIRMPKSTSGYVYLLASMAPGIKNRVTYIGQTFNLVARFEKHQLGAGPSSTADPGLKPWVLLAYVSGFEINDRRPLLTLEDLWKVVRDRENRQHRQQHLPLLRADDIASLGEKIITERTYQQCPALADQNLIFVRCGRFSSHFLSS